ncbi:hypothetical protein T08_4001 [Trichinella sp. T8]|nr:hypothetical protein T08_4001 [Trichinella sp. T8]
MDLMLWNKWAVNLAPCLFSFIGKLPIRNFLETEPGCVIFSVGFQSCQALRNSTSGIAELFKRYPQLFDWQKDESTAFSICSSL